MRMDEREFHTAWIEGTGPLQSRGAAASLFPWWSFTKAVLAMCVLRLRDQGRVDIHAPLPGKRYTPHQLLQHRAGVPDYGRLRRYHAAVARGDVPWTRQELLEAVQGDRLDFAPGSGAWISTRP